MEKNKYTPLKDKLCTGPILREDDLIISPNSKLFIANFLILLRAVSRIMGDFLKLILKSGYDILYKYRVTQNKLHELITSSLKSKVIAKCFPSLFS